MSKRNSILALLCALFALSAVFAPAASAANPEPAWSIQASSAPSNFEPGDESGVATYEAFITNSGAEATDGSPITITDTLPAGLEVKSVGSLLTTRQPFGGFGVPCKTETLGETSTVTCTLEETLPGGEEPAKVFPSEQLLLRIHVKVPPTASGQLVNQLEVTGGGAEPVTAVSHNQASTEEATAGFQEFHAGLTGTDGKPATGSASHPYQYTTSFTVNLNPSPPGSDLPYLPAEGDIKQIEVALPPGLIGNPTSVPRCSAQQFNTIHPGIEASGGGVSLNDCPDSAAVGLVGIQQLEGFGLLSSHAPLYNLVPPKGMPAQFGFQVESLPFYISTKLRSDGDYGVTAYLANTLQIKRISSAQVTIWGTPGDSSHDRRRGHCALEGGNGSCPANLPEVKPFMRLPSSCAFALPTTMSFDTWSDPGTFLSATDTEARPVGCTSPPSRRRSRPSRRPTSPTAPRACTSTCACRRKGDEDPEGLLGYRSLKDATVTLPPGLVVNPASADGLGACSSPRSATRASRKAATASPASPPSAPTRRRSAPCRSTRRWSRPPAAGLGLPGPGENPFDGLIAIYLAIDNPQTGVVVKLPGKVTPDPASGQLSTTVTPRTPNCPSKTPLRLLRRTRAPLRTQPPAASHPPAPHTTTTSLVPWSAPKGRRPPPSDTPSRSGRRPSSSPLCRHRGPAAQRPQLRSRTAKPIGGRPLAPSSCASSAKTAPRTEGPERHPAPGPDREAGRTPECSAAGVAQAQSRGNPDQAPSSGETPSCPVASQLGTVTVAAAPAPPLLRPGQRLPRRPLSGRPTRGAVITPAVAGPFDLGAVVVRAALDVDRSRPSSRSSPTRSRRSSRASHSNVRTVSVDIGRPEFTLNPTGCDVKALTGEATLFRARSRRSPTPSRWRLSNLGFKPKLSLSSRAATARRSPGADRDPDLPEPGAYANIAPAQVALPRSEFLDTSPHQGRSAPGCSLPRVNARQARSRQGHSDHALARLAAGRPGLPARLQQPAAGPGRRSTARSTSTSPANRLGKRRHQNTFEAVPDAPVTKFALSLQAGKKGLFAELHRHLQGHPQGHGRLHRPQRQNDPAQPELEAKCPKARKGKTRAITAEDTSMKQLDSRDRRFLCSSTSSPPPPRLSK